MWPGRARSSARVGSVDHRVHRRAAIGRGDAGGRAGLGVDRDRERGALLSLFSVPDDHQRELELVEPRALERQADHATRVADHERHLLGRHLLRRDDEVAFVLAVLVVDHDDELAASHGVDGFFDLVKVMLCSRLGRVQAFDILRDDIDFEVDGARRRWRPPSVVTASVCGITATVETVGVERRPR